MKLFRKENTPRREISRKGALYCSIAFAFGLDFLAAVLLGVSGVTDAKFLICPVLLVVFDAGFLVLSVFTNYRFRYSIVGTVLYLVCSLALVAAMIALHAGGGVVTATAGLVWSFAHLLSLAGVSLSAFAAARKSVAFKVLSFVSGGVTLVALVSYCAVSFAVGAFGQGLNAGRAVRYEYDGVTDSYIASSLVAGRGDALVVPEKFNGKRVGAADCSIFTAQGLREIYLDSAGELELKNIEDLKDLSEGAVVYADKSEYDVLRGDYFRQAYENSSETLLRFACSFAPTGLEADEVFVSFNYDMDTLKTARGEVLPVWVGKKGDTFRTDFAEVGYAVHTDETKEADLVWCDSNLGGYILAAPVAGDSSIAGKTVDRSIAGARLRFQRIYRVSFGDDNDGVYETAEADRTTQTENGTLGYKLATVNTCDALLENFPRRDGFSLSFRTAGATLSGKLSDLLENRVSRDIEIFPVWSMNAPEIRTLDVQDGNRTVTYGASATVHWTAELPAEGFTPDYTVALPSGEPVALGAATQYALSDFRPNDAGSYTVKIVVSAPEVSSLTAEASETLVLGFEKRELSFAWDALQNSVYDGEDKAIVARIASGTVNEDNVTFTLSRTAVRDARTYPVSVQLTGTWSSLYRISAATQNYSYTVSPRPVPALWNVGTYVYNGQTQSPEAKATLVDGSQTSLSVAGGRADAGHYTATATLNDSNYTLTGATRSYTVLPCPVSVVWEVGTYIYNGQTQRPAASVILVDGSKQILSVTGGRDAGDYTATAILNNSNYTLTGATQGFTVSPCDVTLRVNDAEKIYDGKGFTPTVTAEGLVSGDTLAATLEYDFSCATDLKSAGTHTVALSAKSISRNYTLKTATGGTVTIEKRSVTLKADDKSKIYDGKAFTEFTCTATNLAEGDTEKDAFGVISYTLSGNGIDADTYTITASVSALSGNYELTKQNGTLNIEKRSVSLVWTQKRAFTTEEDAGELKASCADFTLDITYEYYGAAGEKLDGVPKQAGSYTVRAIVGNAQNFTLTSDGNCAFTIEEAEAESGGEVTE